jgi:hypothetical protein
LESDANIARQAILDSRRLSHLSCVGATTRIVKTRKIHEEELLFAVRLRPGFLVVGMPGQLAEVRLAEHLDKLIDVVDNPAVAAEDGALELAILFRLVAVRFEDDIVRAG